MKKKIGIIGGAGPVAGLLLFKKIIKICQKDYGCIKDSDFPEIIVHSFPFSDMLDKPKEELVASELKKSLQFLEDLDCNLILIACNTLHGFLDKLQNDKKLINLIDETKKQMSDQSLVLCTNTSSQKKLYGQNCQAVDELINKVLARKHSLSDSLWLKSNIEEKADSLDSVVLGCSELSVLLDEYPINIDGVEILDPLEIVSKITLGYLKTFFHQAS